MNRQNSEVPNPLHKSDMPKTKYLKYKCQNCGRSKYSEPLAEDEKVMTGVQLYRCDPCGGMINHNVTVVTLSRPL